MPRGFRFFGNQEEVLNRVLKNSDVMVWRLNY
jgi:hypothetical protein